MRIKGAYFIYSLLILVAVLSVVVSSMLLKNISEPQKPRGESLASQPNLASTQFTPTVFDGLVFPSQNASPEEMDRFYIAALKKATGTNEISLKSCKAKPDIIKVAPNSKITINNNDTIIRKISIGHNQTYTVPARGKVRFMANFGGIIGTYGFQCDGSRNISGIIVLTYEERS